MSPPICGNDNSKRVILKTEERLLGFFESGGWELEANRVKKWVDGYGNVHCMCVWKYFTIDSKYTLIAIFWVRGSTASPDGEI